MPSRLRSAIAPRPPLCFRPRLGRSSDPGPAQSGGTGGQRSSSGASSARPRRAASRPRPRVLARPRPGAVPPRLGCSTGRSPVRAVARAQTGRGLRAGARTRGGVWGGRERSDGGARQDGGCWLGLRGALGDMGVGACGRCAVRGHAPGPGRAPGWGRAQGRGWAGRLSARSWSSRTGPAGPPRPAQDLASLWLKAKNTCWIPTTLPGSNFKYSGSSRAEFFYMNSLFGGLDGTVWAMKRVPG